MSAAVAVVRPQRSSDLRPVARRPLQTRWLRPTEVPCFAAAYRDALGLPGACLLAANSELRGFYCEDQLVGGYRLGRTPTRYPALAGRESAASWPFALHEAVEITHLWMDPDLAPTARRIVYGWLLADLLASGKRILLGGSVDADVARQQMRSMPHLLAERAWPEAGPGVRAQVYWGTIQDAVRDAMASGVPLPWVALAG